MIKIEKTSRNYGAEKDVFFPITLPSGRETFHFIKAKKANFDEPAFINILALGDMPLQDIPEFIKAVKLAAMIAAEELVID